MQNIPLPPLLHNSAAPLGKLGFPQRCLVMETSSTGQEQTLRCDRLVPNPHLIRLSVKICLWRHRNTDSATALMSPPGSAGSPPMSNASQGHRGDFTPSQALTKRARGSGNPGLLVLLG